ncbi:MAG: hypothetical protein ACKOAD_04625 [Gammaproteobacteria bacterium]
MKEKEKEFCLINLSVFLRGLLSKLNDKSTMDDLIHYQDELIIFQKKNPELDFDFVETYIDHNKSLFTTFKTGEHSNFKTILNCLKELIHYRFIKTESDLAIHTANLSLSQYKDNTLLGYEDALDILNILVQSMERLIKLNLFHSVQDLSSKYFKNELSALKDLLTDTLSTLKAGEDHQFLSQALELISSLNKTDENLAKKTSEFSINHLEFNRRIQTKAYFNDDSSSSKSSLFNLTDKSLGVILHQFNNRVKIHLMANYNPSSFPNIKDLKEMFSSDQKSTQKTKHSV